MNQRTDPNRSRTPIKRGQQFIPRPSADAAETEAALARKANASRVGGLSTKLKATEEAIEELKDQQSED